MKGKKSRRKFIIEDHGRIEALIEKIFHSVLLNYGG
nr:MAG TPA: hypothetical protein [Caudoviricetes sp.]DAX95309.1 MAG TPA: hypothetical protein [Caudoviricetes sp.]